MGCLFALFAWIFPRIALFLVWSLTDLVGRAFSTWIWPLLGLAFLPLTTLAYVLFWTPGVGLTGWEWLWVVLAFLLDIGSYGGSAYGNRTRF